jgi:hypothetical protein
MSGRARSQDARVRGTGYRHRVGVDHPGPGVVARAPGRWRREPLGWRGWIGGGCCCTVHHCRHARGDAGGRCCRQWQEEETEPRHVEEVLVRVGRELHG